MSGVRRGAAGAAALALLLALVACGERRQTLDSSGKRVDEPAWAASTRDPTFAATGWKAGDKSAWEQQIRQRNQAQNDYAR